MPFVDNKGVRIHYKVEGKGPFIVLLHGFNENMDEWYQLSYVESLKQNYQIILIDMRGHGLSDKPHKSKLYSMELLTSDIITVLDELKVEKAHFWGYSMGGHVGFGLTKHYPDRFHSFILGGISPQIADEELEGKIEKYNQIFKGGAEAYLSNIKNLGVEITTEMKSEIESMDFVALDAFWSADIFHDHEDHLHHFEVPILLYVGEEDSWGHYPRAIECSRTIPKIQVVSFLNQGHGVHSQKDLVLPHVSEFLNKL